VHAGIKKQKPQHSINFHEMDFLKRTPSSPCRHAKSNNRLGVGSYYPILSYEAQPFVVDMSVVDRDRTVSRRSKPNSRNTLIGEQPNPRDRLRPQDVMSRHRGAKQSHQYELSTTISLLSPAYLLSVNADQSTKNRRVNTTGSFIHKYKKTSVEYVISAVRHI